MSFQPILKKTLIPAIKLQEPITHAICKTNGTSHIVVRMQDLLRPDGRSFNALFTGILNAGGFHNYLRYPGTILLSTIMKDRTIFGCDPKTYATVIRELKPDYYFTPPAAVLTPLWSLFSYLHGGADRHTRGGFVGVHLLHAGQLRVVGDGV